MPWAWRSSAAGTLPPSLGKAKDRESSRSWKATTGYRAVYTVRFKEVIYVLHAFQKKSPRGIKTAQVDVDLIERRLKVAQQDYETRYGKPKR
jgi:phage-related protein